MEFQDNNYIESSMILTKKQVLTHIMELPISTGFVIYS